MGGKIYFRCLHKFEIIAKTQILFIEFETCVKGTVQQMTLAESGLIK
jgi:hypothetical protein